MQDDALKPQTQTYIGALCKRGHRHEGTEGSLRYVSDKSCVKCNQITRTRYPRRPPGLGWREASVRYYLGALCKHGHEFGGTGRSLRYRSNRGCVECQSEASARVWAQRKGQDDQD